LHPRSPKQRAIGNWRRKSIAPFELVINGINPLEARDIYRETLEVIEIGLSSNVLNFRGKYHCFVDVPLTLAPFQKPHPPFWYGVFTNPESAVEPARKGWNICGITDCEGISAAFNRYREIAKDQRGLSGHSAKLAIHRIIVVSDTNQQAEDLARTSLPNYKASLNYLWSKFGAKAAQLPESYEAMRDKELIIVGNPEVVREELARQINLTGANYCIVKFSLGDLSDKHTERSIDLFVREIMPWFNRSECHQKTSERPSPLSIRTSEPKRKNVKVIDQTVT
jgi:alkanesulfonate monooxygenase SsuD/methylene tetrahydromethanopterin reductase-like flavin-dependent oxidoreductase (luciferase family)